MQPISPAEIGGVVCPLHHLKSGGVLKGLPELPCDALCSRGGGRGGSVNPGSSSGASPSQQKSNCGLGAVHSALLQPLEGKCSPGALVPSPERGVSCIQIHCDVPKIEGYGNYP